jgi:hypothetical protein
VSAVRRVGAIGVEMGSVDAVMASVGGAAIENGSHDPLQSGCHRLFAFCFLCVCLFDARLFVLKERVIELH